MINAQKLNSVATSGVLNFLTFSVYDSHLYTSSIASELITKISLAGSIVFDTNAWGINNFGEIAVLSDTSIVISRSYDSTFYRMSNSGGYLQEFYSAFKLSSSGFIYNGVRNTLHVNDPAYQGHVIYDIATTTTTTIPNDGGYVINAYDSSGNVYINNAVNSIFKINTLNSKSTLCTISGETSLIGLAIDSTSEYLYTIGSTTKKIYKINLSNGIYTDLVVLPQLPSSQYCISIDNNQNIYVSYGSTSDNIDVYNTTDGLFTYSSIPQAYNSIIANGNIYFLSGDSTSDNYKHIWYVALYVSIPAIPVVDILAVSSITKTTALFNGDITKLSVPSPTLRGFVYDTISHANPGNVAPVLSDYSNNSIESGTFSIGLYDLAISSLIKNTTYYVRAVVGNSNGYSYSSEISFSTVADIFSISGLVKLNNNLIENAIVRVIDQNTNSTLPSVNSDLNGYFQVDDLVENHLYHVMVEYESGAVKYNSLSFWDIEPYLSN